MTLWKTPWEGSKRGEQLNVCMENLLDFEWLFGDI